MDEKQKIISGKRLKKLLDENHFSQTDFATAAQLEGSNIDETNLSKYIKGIRAISKKDLPIFSKLLKVNEEYLKAHLPECKSYYEYVSLCEDKSLFKELMKTSKSEYNLLFQCIGGFILDSGSNENDCLEYGLYRLSDGSLKDFSPSDMELFTDDIRAAVNKLFDKYISKGYTPQTKEEYDRKKKWEERKQKMKEGDADD